MITKRDWDNAKDSKQEMAKLIARETELYLKEGGIITCKDGEDKYTYLEAPDGVTLTEVKTK